MLQSWRSLLLEKGKEEEKRMLVGNNLRHETTFSSSIASARPSVKSINVSKNSTTNFSQQLRVFSKQLRVSAQGMRQQIHQVF